MRPGSSAICWLASVCLASAQSGAPIKTAIKPGPGNKGWNWIVIQNVSRFPLTALSLTFTSSRYSVERGVVRLRPEGAAEVAARPPYSFDSATHHGAAIKPGGKLQIGAQAFDPSAQIVISAAVFADGETFGDPAQIQVILEKRRETLQVLPVVIRNFPTRPPPPGAVCVVAVPAGPRIEPPRAAGDIGMNPMPGPGETVITSPPAGPIIPSLSLGPRNCLKIEYPKNGPPFFRPVLRAALADERKEVKSLSMMNALLWVDSEIERNAYLLRGLSPGRITEKLRVMLRVWQDDLSHSLPSLASTP